MNQAIKIVKQDWTEEQINLITATIARNATPDELKLFLYRCQTLGLDPLKPGVIHFVKYGAGPGSIVIGIEGFRSLAARTGKLAGIKRGTLKTDKGILLGAWAEVYRSDWKEPAREEISLAEYNTGKSMWARMPETMAKKVAECAALRMAFPDDLGGVYEHAEMDQAEKDAGRVLPEQPEDGNGFEDGAYRIPFGKFAKRSLEEVGPKDLENYIHYLQSKAEKDGKEIKGIVADFIDRAADYLGAMENKAIDEMRGIAQDNESDLQKSEEPKRNKIDPFIINEDEFDKHHDSRDPR